MSFTAWSYKQTHSITHGTGVTDYQVRFTVYKTSGTSSGSSIYCNTHCKDDFSDIRFSVNSSTSLPYWIESYTSGVSAIIWVKLPSITTTTITVYYGNAAATSESSGDNTFIFFDNFSGVTLNATKWPSLVNSVTYTVNNKLIITGGTSSAGTYWIYDNTDTGDQIVSNVSSIPTNVEVISKQVAYDTSASQMGQVGPAFTSSNNIQACIHHGDGSGTTIALYENSIIGATPGTPLSSLSSPDTRILSLQKIGTSYTGRSKLVSDSTWTTVNQTLSNATGVSKFAIAVGTYGGYAFLNKVEIEYIFLKNSDSTEPSHGSWSGELSTIPTILFNPTNPAMYELISFTLSSESIPVSYSWNFGDSSHSTSSAPYKIYSESGNKSVSLTMKFEDDTLLTATTSVSVSYVWPTYGANILISPETPYETEEFSCTAVNIAIDPSVPSGSISYDRTFPITVPTLHGDHFTMAIDFDGNFYHAERVYSSGYKVYLYKYNSSGTLLKSVQVYSGNVYPSYIKFNEDCSILYALVNYGIYQYDKDLNLIRSWWPYYPFDCFAVKGEYVYGVGNVFGANNLFVSVQDNLGTYIRQFGSGGTGDGQIYRSVNIFLDSGNNIWVGDYGAAGSTKTGNLLQKFTNSGTFVASYVPWSATQLFMENNTVNDHIYVGRYNAVDVYDSSMNLICTYTGNTTIIKNPLELRSNHLADEKIYVFDNSLDKIQVLKFSKGYSLRWITEDHYVSTEDVFATDCTSPTSTQITLEIVDLLGNVYPTVTPFIEVTKRNRPIEVSFSYTKSE